MSRYIDADALPGREPGAQDAAKHGVAESASVADVRDS